MVVIRYYMTGNMEQAAIQHRKCLAIYTSLFPDQPDMLSAKNPISACCMSKSVLS